MLKLSSAIHSMFNDRVIIQLRDKDIVTVADFLRTDSNNLKQFTKIGMRIGNKLPNFV